MFFTHFFNSSCELVVFFDYDMDSISLGVMQISFCVSDWFATKYDNEMCPQREKELFYQS